MSHSRVGLLCRKIITNHMRRCVRWDQTSAANVGKISLNMLSDHLERHILIKSISQTGFVLHNEDIRIVGPSVFFPREVFHWNVKDIEDIHEASLSLFTMLEPKVDILIIGLGDKMARLNPAALRYLKANKINFEVLATEKAAALFNFLNSESRQVAAALLPMKEINLDLVVPKDDDLIPFLTEIDIFDPNLDKLDPPTQKSFAEYMLQIPGERVKTAKTNIQDILDKRERAKEIINRSIEKVMDEVEKETEESKKAKEETSAQNARHPQRESKGVPDGESLQEGADTETKKINSEKDSKPSKS